MASRELTTNELLDLDLAILVFGAPIWIAGFVGLVVAGAIKDSFRQRSQPKTRASL